MRVSPRISRTLAAVAAAAALTTGLVVCSDDEDAVDASSTTQTTSTTARQYDSQQHDGDNVRSPGAHFRGTERGTDS